MPTLLWLTSEAKRMPNNLPIQSSFVQFIVSLRNTRSCKLFITTDVDVHDTLYLVTLLSGPRTLVQLVHKYVSASKDNFSRHAIFYAEICVLNIIQATNV